MAAVGLLGASAAITAFEQLKTGATGLSGASMAIQQCQLIKRPDLGPQR